MHGRRIERQCRSVNFVALGCPTLLAFANRVGLVPCHGVQPSRSKPNASSAKCSNRIELVDSAPGDNRPGNWTGHRMRPVQFGCATSGLQSGVPRDQQIASLDKAVFAGYVRGCLEPAGAHHYGLHLIGTTTREQRFRCYARGSVPAADSTCCSAVATALLSCFFGVARALLRALSLSQATHSKRNYASHR